MWHCSDFSQNVLFCTFARDENKESNGLLSKLVVYVLSIKKIYIKHLYFRF